MTYKYRIERQLKLYIAFLPFCTSQKQTFSLLDEITELRYKIEKIGRMTASNACSDVKTVCVIQEGLKTIL